MRLRCIRNEHFGQLAVYSHRTNPTTSSIAKMKPMYCKRSQRQKIKMEKKTGRFTRDQTLSSLLLQYTNQNRHRCTGARTHSKSLSSCAVAALRCVVIISRILLAAHETRFVYEYEKLEIRPVASRCFILFYFFTHSIHSWKKIQFDFSNAVCPRHVSNMWYLLIVVRSQENAVNYLYINII